MILVEDHFFHGVGNPLDGWAVGIRGKDDRDIVFRQPGYSTIETAVGTVVHYSLRIAIRLRDCLSETVVRAVS